MKRSSEMIFFSLKSSQDAASNQLPTWKNSLQLRMRSTANDLMMNGRTYFLRAKCSKSEGSRWVKPLRRPDWINSSWASIMLGCMLHELCNTNLVNKSMSGSWSALLKYHCIIKNAKISDRMYYSVIWSSKIRTEVDSARLYSDF